MTQDETNPTPDAAETSTSRPKRFLCRHIFTSGRRCGSPALRGEQFCYYHHTTRRPAPRHHGVHPSQAVFELPAIDDRTGIQFALAQLLARIASNQLDHKRSGQLLNGLQIASRNLRRDPRPAAASRSDSRCDSRSSRHSSSRESSSFSSRESSSFSICESDSPSGPNAPDALVEEIILDSDLGPIAPIAELPPPQDPEAAAEAAAEAHRSAFALFLEENCFPASAQQPATNNLQPTTNNPEPARTPTHGPLTTDHCFSWGRGTVLGWGRGWDMRLWGR